MIELYNRVFGFTTGKLNICGAEDGWTYFSADDANESCGIFNIAAFYETIKCSLTSAYDTIFSILWWSVAANKTVLRDTRLGRE